MNSITKMAQILDKPTYNLIINSSDKISGTNNNATFQINWDDFLPRKFNMYKVIFSFQTTGGYYKDNTATPIVYSVHSVLLGEKTGRAYALTIVIQVAEQKRTKSRLWRNCNTLCLIEVFIESRDWVFVIIIFKSF